MTSIMKVARPVIKRILTSAEREGVGDGTVRRSIGGLELNQFDPFLVLDEVNSETGTGGFPDHPHRGFETVTYMLEGGVQHEDFEGHKGVIGAGDLQWMTAGKGIIHSEVGAGIGKTRGLQLWVNLSSQYKMIEPNYQELLSKDIAEVERDGIKVRVIAGEAFGIKSQIYTRTPTMYLDFTLQQGSHLEQPIPASWNAFVYVLEGEGVFGDSSASPAKRHQLLILGSNGDGVEAWNNSATPLRFVLVGGQPLKEPVAAYGPFVMNTREEIEQTFRDYRSFTNGFEKARSWRSEAARRLNM
ncbi:transcription cofactor [Lithospermum erythrorhizon]|uniref:Transcription cofactor n=1 Tax=Lithospermum erythrorhizon TaxID=34254 RepID=A0AAV3R1Y8_LITER